MIDCASVAPFRSYIVVAAVRARSAQGTTDRPVADAIRFTLFFVSGVRK
jgi:hypothetical protein